METTCSGLRWGASLEDVLASATIDGGQAADYKLAAQDNGSRCPMAAWVVGVCPACGGDLVCMSYDSGLEYRIIWHCWGSIGQSPRCRYRAEPGA